MIIQLYRDNYTTTPVERLNFTLYNGYFNGTDANANLGFFDTAEVLATGSTSNLSNLETTSNSTFQQNFNDNEAMNDNWNMTGYTYSASNLTVTTRTNNNLRLTMTGLSDPQLNLQGTRPTVNSNNFKYIHLRYKVVSGNADYFQIFYYNTTGQAISGTRSKVINYGTITFGEWKTVVIDMSNDPNWITANWNQYRLDPISGDGNFKDAVIDFDYFIISNSINPPDYDTKSLKASGYFRAKKTGIYRFFTRSDDASFLAINDAIVVFNGGAHGAQDRFGNVSMTAGTYYKFDIYYGDSSSGQSFSAGYLEPNDDGTTSDSTNLEDFITNGTGLTTYYDINPETQPTSITNQYPLILEDNSLYGLFRISPLSLYINRTPFSTSKHDILYLASEDLFNNFNGTYKNYIQLHEKPVANDVERKRFTQFSHDMSFECELNGRIEVTLRRGSLEPIGWRYAMLILQLERVPDTSH
jgi:hypothetical protein